jgi:hypothetical protein
VDRLAPAFQSILDRAHAAQQNQGAFHPPMLGVTDPITSRAVAGPMNTQAMLSHDATQNTDPHLLALHQAIARYYQG